MFENIPFYKVNREERHYCFLLGAEIINNSEFRKRFFSLLNSKYNLDVKTESFEIYFEVAALRDYWFYLGDSEIYSQETHEKRLAVLTAIFKFYELDFNEYITENLFWTGEPKNSKLWSPARWSSEKLKLLNASDKLFEIRACFNSKPDFLIVSNGNLLVFEAKIESGQGIYQSGKGQSDIQKQTFFLMQKLIPYFENNNPTFINLTLEKNASTSQWEGWNNLFWNDVIELITESNSPKFIQNSFSARVFNL